MANFSFLFLTNAKKVQAKCIKLQYRLKIEDKVKIHKIPTCSFH